MNIEYLNFCSTAVLFKLTPEVTVVIWIVSQSCMNIVSLFRCSLGVNHAESQVAGELMSVCI